MAKKTPDFEQILTEQQKNSKTLEKVVNLLEEGLVKKTGDGLNNNINKFVEEMTVAFKLQNRLLEESNKIQNKVFKKINSESSEAPFKGGQYYGGVRDWAREKNQKTFNMAWWLGITPESKGLTANLVRRRQARQEFVKSAVNIGDLSKKEAKQKFKELNRIRGKRSEVEQQIAKLQKQGLLEEDIQKYKTKEGPSLFELRKQYAEQEKNAVRITKPERGREETAGPTPETPRPIEVGVPTGTDVSDKRSITEEEGEDRLPDVGLGALNTADTPINPIKDIINPETPTAISDERVVTEEEKRVFVESEKQTGLLGSMNSELKDIHETLKKCCSQITNIAGGDSGFGIPGFGGGFPDIDVDLPDRNKPRTTSGGAAGGKKGWFQRAKDWTKDLLKSGSKASKGLKIGGGALGVLGGALAISEAISDIADLDEKLEAGLTYIDDQIKNEDISPEEGQKLKDAWYQQIAVEKAGEAGEATGTIAGGLAGAAAGVATGAAAGLVTGPLAPIVSPILGIAGGIGGAIYGGDWGKDIAKWATSPGPKQQAVNEQIANRVQEQSTSKEKVKAGLTDTKINKVTEDMSLTDFISVGESKGDYNIYNMGAGHKYKAGREDLSQMTLNEVMRRQNLDSRSSQKLFAVGKHQIIPKTMEAAKRSIGLTGEEMFTPELQERIFAEYLTQEKRPDIEKFIKGKGDIDKAALAIGQEWASVGVDAKGGASYYDKDGINKAHVSPEQAKNALNVAKKRYEDAIAAGKSEADAYREAVLGIEKVESKEDATKPNNDSTIDFKKLELNQTGQRTFTGTVSGIGAGPEFQKLVNDYMQQTGEDDPDIASLQVKSYIAQGLIPNPSKQATNVSTPDASPASSPKSQTHSQSTQAESLNVDTNLLAADLKAGMNTTGVMTGMSDTSDLMSRTMNTPAQVKAEPIDARSAGFFGTGETVADRLATEESWGPDKEWATEAKPVNYKPAGVVPQAALNLEQKMLLAADKPKTAADILEDEFDEAVYQERKNIAEYDIRKNEEAKQKAEAIKQKDLQGLPQADVVGWRSFEGSATPLAPQPMSSADNVYQSSSNVSDTERELKTATPASNVVNAPVVNNVNNQSNVSGPSSPRNTDSAWQKYSSFTYGWGMT